MTAASQRQRSKRRSISAPVRARVYENDCGRCVVCGSTENLTVDHRIPLSRGGSNREKNLQTMCDPCNQEKKDALPVEIVAAGRRGPHGEELT